MILKLAPIRNGVPYIEAKVVEEGNKEYNMELAVGFPLLYGERRMVFIPNELEVINTKMDRSCIIITLKAKKEISFALNLGETKYTFYDNQTTKAITLYNKRLKCPPITSNRELRKRVRELLSVLAKVLDSDGAKELTDLLGEETADKIKRCKEFSTSWTNC